MNTFDVPSQPLSRGNSTDGSGGDWSRDVHNRRVDRGGGRRKLHDHRRGRLHHRGGHGVRGQSRRDDRRIDRDRYDAREHVSRSREREQAVQFFFHPNFTIVSPREDYPLNTSIMFAVLITFLFFIAARAATTTAASTAATAGGGRAVATSATTAAAGLAAATTEAGGGADGAAAGLGGLGSRFGAPLLFDSASSSTGAGAVADVADASGGLQSAMSGAEELLLGDATTADAIASGAGNAADSMLVAAGDAGAGGALSTFLPGWLVSGGLAALASEAAFAVFAIALFFSARANSNEAEAVESVKDDLTITKGAVDDLATEEEIGALTQELTESGEGAEYGDEVKEPQSL